MPNITLSHLALVRSVQKSSLFPLHQHFSLSVQNSLFSKIISHIVYTCQGGHFTLSHSRIHKVLTLPIVAQRADFGLPYGEGPSSYSGTDFRKKRGLLFLVSTNEKNRATDFDIWDCSFSQCVFNPNSDESLKEYTASVIELQTAGFNLESCTFTGCVSYSYLNPSAETQSNSGINSEEIIRPMIHLYNVQEQSVFKTVTFTNNVILHGENHKISSAAPILQISNGTFKAKWVYMNFNSSLPINYSLLYFHQVSGTRLNYMNFVISSKQFDKNAFAVVFSNCQASTLSNMIFDGCGNQSIQADTESQKYLIMKNMCFEKQPNFGNEPIGVKTLITESCPLDPALLFSSLVTSATLGKADGIYAITTIVIFLVVFVVAFVLFLVVIFIKQGNKRADRFGRLRSEPEPIYVDGQQAETNETFEEESVSE